MWEERKEELTKIISKHMIGAEDIIISQEKDMIYDVLLKIWDLNFGQYSFIAFKDLRTEINDLLKSYNINKAL